MINPDWLELQLSRTKSHGPKGVRAIEVLLYSVTQMDVIFSIFAKIVSKVSKEFVSVHVHIWCLTKYAINRAG